MNADQFQLRMAQLPEPKTDLRPPYWEAWRLDLWQRARAQDPARFWEWPCVYHTMLVNHWQGAIRYEINSIRFDYEEHLIKVPHAGPDDQYSTTSYSMNLIHQLYHIQQWERATGRRINQLDTIVEFGGGYGAMALLCHRLGFEGKYIIYDLPEFSLLQEYYLSQFGILDKVSWNPKRKPKDVDLFMALYSLSEVEPSERGQYVPVAKSYLLLYSGQWEKWNNVHLFQNEFVTFKETKKGTFQQYDMNWQHTELAHLPDLNNWYSIGW